MSWTFLINNNVSEVPISFADFIIALNLSEREIRKYSTREILIGLNNDELQKLSNQLTLSHVDKERIVRILGYLGLLINDFSIYDTLPNAVLGLIIKDFNNETIKLVCKISGTFRNFCQSEEFFDVLRQRIRMKNKINISKLGRDELLRLSSIEKYDHISAGGSHSLILTEKGEVYSFGSNNFGQLGINNFINRDTPISVMNNIVQVSAGGTHSLLLDAEGNVWSFGSNQFGQLGLGDIQYKNTPTLIPQLTDIIYISAGRYHSLAVNSSGRVYSFGYNFEGQLGIKEFNIDTKIPILIPDLYDIIQVSGGDSHSLALDSKGDVYAFGSNQSGQLGPIYHEFPSLNNLKDVNKILHLSDIVQVSAGHNHSLVLDNKRRVYAFGENFTRQLTNSRNFVIDRYYTGKPGELEYFREYQDIISISAGGDFSLLINVDKEILSFGRNRFGQLGHGYAHNTGISSPTQIYGMSNIEEISAGHDHSLALDSKGNVYSFGVNNKGQLGLGNNGNANVPTIIPNFNIYS